MLKDLFILTLLLLSQSSAYATRYTGNFTEISDADLFANYYQPVARAANEVRVLIFGDSRARRWVQRDYSESISDFNMIFNRFMESDVKTIRLYRSAGDWISYGALESDLAEWAKRNAVTGQGMNRLYRELGLRLEERIIAGADVLFFDVWGISDSTQIEYVKDKALFGAWKATLLDNHAPTQIGDFFDSPFDFTALKYQMISANTQYSEKTILTYSGVPLADQDVRKIVKQSPNPENRQWGTKKKPKQLRNLIQFYSAWVKKRADCTIVDENY